MTKRQQCRNCQRPTKVCLCNQISAVSHRTPVHVLMHPSEQGNAKGTAVVLCLGLEQGNLWVGEQPSDFSELQQQLALGPQPAMLLYPDDNATAIEQLTEATAIGQLVVLDGTWRKTHKMLQLNPWLQQLPTVSFSNAPQGDYQIRKANRDDSLSTLEAVAYALEQIEQCDTAPLYRSFDAIKQAQLAYMPADVRARYR
ncbi:tRNA-uridine aminocarboxypropyltransferase [Ferrimonas lipolytica]|uniref:tRNA-uridine aminocarboxypropyltransferase n=1 Tax=Ferrimonas lipolytica TaxID=2724191 RepID=A0A6H1UFT3_9GAMM|nr:tRNA-uridine aminocarboxypropyltransferase [Ferrimonas lipolytica]QIZ77965.1 DTW domain-containing protein [Ferrimonas lipolytica]